LLTTWLGLVWGLVQGVRHAVEPDHLAAVSTLVAERRSARSAAGYAVLWGAGHALVLLVVGGALLLLRGRMPERLAAVFELLVAAMLVALGLRALARAIRKSPAGGGAPREPHQRHEHGTIQPERGPALSPRPLLVGCIHGLAGTGALVALVAAQMRSLLAGFVYIALYGGGAALGMAVLAGLAGLPLARLVQTRHGVPVVLGTTGALSLALGVAWGWSATGPAFR
jgi:hypothetical protein